MARKFVGASHHSETRARPMDIRNTRNRPGSVGIPADLLPFPQWQAKQLVSRDAMFGFFLLLVYVVYLQKTTPDFCASTTALHGEGQRTPLQTKQQQWPVLWSLVCDDAATAAGTLAPSVKFSWLLQSAVRVLQGLATFFCAGLLSNDPIHMFVGSLRLSLLLLIAAKFPYISPSCLLHKMIANISSTTTSSSSTTTSSSGSSSIRPINWYNPVLYWQNPSFRICVIAAQRLIPPAVELVCWNVSGCHMGWYAAVHKSPMTHELGKYMFQGWMAGTLVLPLRAHLIVNIAEWIIIYFSSSYTMGTSDANSSSSSSSSRLFWDFKCLCASFLCVSVLPTLGVLWLESSQKRRYQQLQQQQQQRAMDGKRSDLSKACASSSSSSSSGSSSSGSERAHKSDQAIYNSRDTKDSCWNSSSSSSKTCTKDTAMEDSAMDVRTYCLLDAEPAVTTFDSASILLQSHAAAAAAAAAAVVGPNPNISHLIPIISNLLGSDAAESIAAAVSVSSSVKPYSSVAAALAVSIKVHDPSHSVSRLAPVLTSVLHHQLMSGYNTHSSPLAIHTAAFEGCVQLIANVIGIRRDFEAAAAAGGSISGSSTPRSAAASLLSKVQQSIQDWATAGAAVGPENSLTAAAASQPAVDVAVGGDAASSASSSTSSSSSNHAGIPSVILQSVDPICLIADQTGDQEIRLSLTLSGQQQQQQQQPAYCCHGAAAAPSGPDPDAESASPGYQDQALSGLSGSARLLVLRDGVVLWDQEVNVINDRISTFVSLPPQPPGALHLALLPANTLVAAAEAAGNSEASAAAAALPVLQPLLVLPAAAAADLQQYYERIQTLDPNSRSDTKIYSGATAAHHTAWQNVSAISVDVTYIVTTCAIAAAAADCNGGSAVKQQLPSGVQQVLKSLLVHLASCGMFEMMTWLVELVAAVYVKDDRSSSSSSSSSDVVVPCTDLSATQACSSLIASSSSLNASISSSTTKTSTVINNGQSSDGKSATAVKHGSSSSGKAATAAAKVGQCLSPITSKSVAASELLWGFRDPAIETSYQAAAFTSSGFWDFISFAFTASMSLPFFLKTYNSSSTSSSADAVGRSMDWARPNAETLSDWLLTSAYLSGPLLVLLLRIRTAWQLEQQQQQRDLAAATAILFREAAIKQRLLLIWMALMPVMLAVFAVSDVLVTPAWLVRVWSSDSTSADVGGVFVVAIKGWTGQIPFAAFWPILAAQGFSSLLGSIRYGVRPYYWLAMRYIAMVLLPTAVNARQHIQGRRTFCVRQGITVR